MEMNNRPDVYGIKAIVFIKDDGDIGQMGEKLKKILVIHDLWYDTDSDPPHDMFAMGESLGLECWIAASSEHSQYSFVFEIGI